MITNLPCRVCPNGRRRYGDLMCRDCWNGLSEQVRDAVWRELRREGGSKTHLRAVGNALMVARRNLAERQEGTLIGAE